MGKEVNVYTPISVVIITFNEEKNIERCIQSVKLIADDIVVVDSNSTDNTCKLASTIGARVITHAFEGHIEQKNWAITQAKYPHILSLDADEQLSEILIQSILTVKNNFEADGYSMNRLNYYCGQWIKHGGWYPDTKLRLWDSRLGKWDGINPHDKYELNANCIQKKLSGDLLHYTYFTREQHIKQIEYFTSIAANAYKAKGKKSSYFKMYFNSTVKFVKDYFLKIGFLDGKAGFEIALNSAYATFLKYKKLKALNGK